ncbi:Uncharacterised protein [Campylobacter hyointestinalis]|uniref:hypothetical protein n=1 Tax=Campylobacter hyointestinalis TaxID=198 RepID=UPI00072452CF|nr:hypothetical protein [Campylobacter hyointestinalis]CUU76198.1 Uncharacterised protein [Campylobacter hyointestinalis]CUU78852.1 Uncharacterised protein [Campylobacter hyointestinalis subsp. hyointestinalis]
MTNKEIIKELKDRGFKFKVDKTNVGVIKLDGSFVLLPNLAKEPMELFGIMVENMGDFCLEVVKNVGSKEEIKIYEDQHNREKRFEQLKNELDKKHSFIRYAKKDEGTEDFFAADCGDHYMLFTKEKSFDQREQYRKELDKLNKARYNDDIYKELWQIVK